MSLEEFKHPIESGNMQEHERLLNEQIRKAQILFTESKFINNDNKDLKYSDLLEKNTHLISSIVWIYEKNLKNTENIKYPELDELGKKFKEVVKIDIDNIVLSSSGEDRVDKILNYINTKYSEYPQESESIKDNNHVGLIKYEERVSSLDEEKDEEKLLKATGLNKKDDYLRIHLAPAYVNNNELNPNKIKKWLSELAEVIIDKFPEARAIVGTSWLFDHPIMKRLGFKIIDEKSGRENWSQIINKDGQIDTDRLEDAIKNGELPFKNLTGYIFTEDFLKKYLPENRRGEIILKEVDQEYLAFRNKFREELNNLKELIINTPQDKLSIDNFLNKIPTLMDIAKNMGTENKVKEIFEYCLKNKIPITEINKHPELFKKYETYVGPIFNKFKEKKYIDKKVII
jgi:hypothetical protein